MSHSSGKVHFGDGEILHFEYNGTSDVCYRDLYKTYEEMDENWRTSKYPTCSCGNDEKVIIETMYGGGFHWSGRACRHCMCITANTVPDFVEGVVDGEYVRED